MAMVVDWIASLMSYCSPLSFSISISSSIEISLDRLCVCLFFAGWADQESFGCVHSNFDEFSRLVELGNSFGGEVERHMTFSV